MKKIAKTILSLLVVATTISMIACGGKKEEQKPHTHSYDAGVVLKDATCMEKGEKRFTCECGDVYVSEISALGHALTHVNAKAPTCQEFGWDEYDKCTRLDCTYTTYEKKEALGHDLKNGLCQREDCDYKSPTGHTCQWDDGVITVAPTCTETGEIKYICACEDFRTDEVKELGHDKQETFNPEATCTEPGLKTITCGRVGCTLSETQTVPAKGHNYTDGVCHCGAKQTINVTYYLVDGNGKVYELKDYAKMKEENGNYPDKVESANSSVTISSLKVGEIEVKSSKYYGMEMKFGGWYKEEACKNLLSEAGEDLVLDLSEVNGDTIALYGKVDVASWVGPF